MIKNKTKNTIIADRYNNKKLTKIFGLIGKNKPEALIFKTRFGIHTFFLKFPIDVLILDKQNKVKVTKKGLKTNRIFVWNLKYDMVIELPLGSIEKSQTQKDDIIQFNL